MTTSNGLLEDWGKLIGDVPAATAILDSLPHHAEIPTLKGRSYRLKSRQKKQVVQGEREEETASRKTGKPRT